MKFKIQKKNMPNIFSLILGVVLAIVLSQILKMPFFETLEQKSLDYRMINFRNVSKKSDEIIIVDIDDVSLQELGAWAWPRKYHGAIVDYLNDMGVKVIGFDILFTEPDINNIESDIEMANLIENKPVFLAMVFTTSPRSDTSIPDRNIKKWKIKLADNYEKNQIIRNSNLTAPVKRLLDKVYGVAHINMYAENDGVVRAALTVMEIENRYYVSLNVALIAEYFNQPLSGITLYPGEYLEFPDVKRNGETVKIPIEPDGRLMLNYYGTAFTYEYVPFYKLYYVYKYLKGELDIDWIKKKVFPESDNVEKAIEDFNKKWKNKIVLVGSSSKELLDQRTIPHTPIAPGVEIHANAINNIMKLDYLMRPARNIRLWIFLGIALIVTLFSSFSSAVKTLFVIVSISVLYIIIAFFVFYEYSIWLDLINIFIVSAIIYLSVIILRYFAEAKEKGKIKNAFSRYVTASVVNDILADPEKLKLGGTKKELTVLFSGLVNFTDITEPMKPEDMVELLQEYLTYMTEIILDTGGTLDKYEGDTIMAFWGAPIDYKDHAIRACEACINNLKKLDELNKKWKSDGKPNFNMEIGLNTGPMIVGNMGSKNRFDYTVMGDAVNLGARIKGINKVYNTRIAITESTYLQVKDKIVTRLLDSILVKGKKIPIPSYEVICKKGETTQQVEDTLAEFERGRQLYLKRDWDKAIQIFEDINKKIQPDGPSMMYIERCHEYKVTPPPENWDGAYTMTTK